MRGSSGGLLAVGTQNLSAAIPEHDSRLRSPLVVGSGHGLGQFACVVGPEVSPIVGLWAADVLAKELWRSVLSGILNFLVAFGARPRPLYGCMNLEGRAVAVDERPGAVLQTPAELDRGSYRSQRVEDDTLSQVDPFNPLSGAR